MPVCPYDGQEWPSYELLRASSVVVSRDPSNRGRVEKYPEFFNTNERRTRVSWGVRVEIRVSELNTRDVLEACGIEGYVARSERSRRAMALTPDPRLPTG